ncbi:hypothetical protein CK203_012687 [Vitis vinifera]|uniref:DUF4283 domain-containing protein n=1 Tax=Vitis vinifera TaxID=29760 RepID=A0A438KN96_VITVI|nr:hypothetical protein CK203_012687 [Vitis vinifera]
MEKGSLGSNNVQMKQERSSFVVDMKARRYRLVFPEVTLTDSKISFGSVVVKVESSSKVPMEKAKGSFVNVLKAKARRLSEVVWLQLRGRDLLSTKEQLDRCLVGKWGKPSISVLHLLLLRSWGRFHWNLKGGVKIAKLGGAFLFFEFEDKAEANRVLKRGFQCFKEKLLHLERWGIEVGCFQKAPPKVSEMVPLFRSGRGEALEVRDDGGVTHERVVE